MADLPNTIPTDLWMTYVHYCSRPGVARSIGLSANCGLIGARYMIEALKIGLPCFVVSKVCLPALVHRKRYLTKNSNKFTLYQAKAFFIKGSFGWKPQLN